MSAGFTWGEVVAVLEGRRPSAAAVERACGRVADLRARESGRQAARAVLDAYADPLARKAAG